MSWEIDVKEEKEIKNVERSDLLPKERIAQVEEHIKLVKEFVMRQMEEGTDYGTVVGIEKPFLFKAGAEKLLNLFNFTAKFEIMKEVVDWQKDFVYYKIKCTIYHGDEVRGEGFGSCNSKERKYKGRNAFDLDNTILKMAKKRALVDAVLTATRASFYFTQDEEVVENGDVERYKKLVKKEKEDNFRSRLLQAIDKKAKELGISRKEVIDKVALYIRKTFQKAHANELTEEERKQTWEYLQRYGEKGEETEDVNIENADIENADIENADIENAKDKNTDNKNNGEEILNELLQDEAKEFGADFRASERKKPVQKKVQAIKELIKRLKKLAQEDKEKAKQLEEYLNFYSDWQTDNTKAKELRESLKVLEKEWLRKTSQE